MKTLNVEIVSSSDNTLPASGLVKLSLADVSLADAPSITVAELHLRCAGLMPINLQLSYDPSQIDSRHTYALQASITQDDCLLYSNTTAHHVALDKVFGPLKVTVDKVHPVAGIHGDNSVEGIHGGNRMD
ncbi:YbaY family lipoprotein [Pseudomonas putida]